MLIIIKCKKLRPGNWTKRPKKRIKTVTVNHDRFY